MTELTPAQESFAANSADIAVLTGLHWRELYGTTEGYGPDFKRIAESEKNGGVAYFTLRTPEGKLAGHFCAMVYVSPFYGKLVAMDIFYYILPEYRGSFGMCKLLKFAGNAMKKQGVDQVIVSHMSGSKLGPILSRAGFNKAGEMYFFEG
jgi:hypothetical protein